MNKIPESLPDPVPIDQGTWAGAAAWAATSRPDGAPSDVRGVPEGGLAPPVAADLAHALDLLPEPAFEAMRSTLPDVAARTIDAVVTGVPAYRDELGSTNAETLATAVQQALNGFLTLAEQSRDPSAPLLSIRAGAYALGRGEARSGRSLDSLLAAYRVGARVAWRQLAGAAAESGARPDVLVAFAELVFAYIDELSAASVAGHADELALEGLARQRHLERLAHGLVSGAEESALLAAAQAADWSAPALLVAVLLDEQHVGPVLSRVDRRSLQPLEDVPGVVDGEAVLLVAEPSGGEGLPHVLARALAAAHETEGPTDAWIVVGPPRPWLSVRESFDRALRARTQELGRPATGLPAAGTAGGAKTFWESRVVSTEDLLPELVVSADPAALADLRARALAPLAELRPAQAERLTQTLRSWLLHHGRREDVARELFVHPQTVRYRMNQLREVFGDALDDPRSVLELTVALTAPVDVGAAAVLPDGG